MKRKQALRILLVLGSFIFIMFLAGCDIQQEDADTPVSLRYDTKTIYLYSSEDCKVELKIEVDDGNATTIKKTVELKSGTTLKLGLDEIAPDFFSSNAKITNVSTSISKSKILSLIAIFLGSLGVLINSILIITNHVPTKYKEY